MQSIRIVTDTTANMPPAIAERHGVTIVPVYVTFGDKSYRDYEEMTPAVFYVMLAEVKARGGEMPKSSQPSPGDFDIVYKHLAAQGAHDIISIHVTAKSSGTVNSAAIAKDMVSSKVKVHVVDSATTSMHMGYMIVEAARVIESGGSLEQALAAIDHVKENSCLYFTVTEVEHLEASGRTEGTERISEAAIKVKPVIGIIDGRPQVITPERTQRAAIDKVIELTKTRLAGKKLRGVTVVHGNAIDRAEALKMRVPDDLAYDGEILITDFGPALGVHFGPGLLGLAAYAE